MNDDAKVCENCKFWDRYVGQDSNFGSCPEMLKYRQYIDVHIEGDGQVEYFETYEDFGCVLWEEK